MKGKLSRVWRKGMSLLIVLCMIVGMCPAVFAEESVETTATKKYVSLGDSMANGYGLPGYADYYENGKEVTKNGYLQEAPDAYPAQVAEYFGWDLTQLAMSAMRAEDLHYVLEYPNSEPWDYYTEDEFTGSRFKMDLNKDGVKESTVADVAKVYQDAVTEADVISLGIGNANFGVFMLGRITNALGVLGGDASDDSWINLEIALQECDEETKALVLGIYDELKAELAKYLTDEAAVVVDPLVNAVSYGVVSYVLNYAGVIERIVELNPDAEIILVGLMNTFSGMDMTYEGQTIPMGEIMSGVIKTMNTYLAAQPAAMQLAGKYPDATFYFAEATDVSVIVDNFADEIKQTNTVVRDRTIEEVVDLVWPMLNGMTTSNEPTDDDNPYIEITRDDVETYEDAYKKAFEEGGDPAAFAKYAAGKSDKLLQSIATYLAFEKATIAASQKEELDANAFIALANGLDGIFTDVYTNFDAKIKDITTDVNQKHMNNAMSVVTSNNGLNLQKIYSYFALPDAMSSALCEDDTVYSLLNLFARMLIGNGIGCHPSAAGHDTLTEAIVATYENGYKASDAVIDKATIALDALYKLIEEYGPEAVDQAYQYALENGYIDALEQAIEELKLQAAAYAEEAIPVIEATIAELEAKAAAMEAELAALKAQLEAQIDALEAALENAADEAAAEIQATIDQIEATIDQLEAAIEEVKTVLEDVYEKIEELTALLADVKEEAEVLCDAVAEIEAAVGNLYEVLENTTEATVESVLAAVEAAKAAVEAAIEVVETVQDSIEKIVADINTIAETLGIDVEAVCAAVEEAMAGLGDLVSEEVEAVVATLKAMAEEEIAALQEELNAVMAEIEAEIAAKVAEAEAAIEAKIAEIEAEIAAKKAELENAAEELKAEIEAEIEKLEAEVEALKAELEQKVAEITAEVEAAYAETVAALEAAIEEVKAEVEAAVAALEAAVVENAEKAIAEITAAAEKAVEELTVAAEELLEEVTILVNEKVEEIVAAWEAAYADATTAEYVVDEDSYYVAIGDGSAVSESYVDALATELDVDYKNLAQDGLLIQDAATVIAPNAAEIAKADLITVGFSNVTFLEDAINKALNGVDLDWSTYVPEEALPYIDEAMAELDAYLTEAGLEDFENVYPVKATVKAVIEAYAYSTVAYACAMPEVVNAIHELNPEALIVVVGMSNPFAGVDFVMPNGEIVDLGEYFGYMVEAANIHGTAYCMLTGNAIYVEAPEADTINEKTTLAVSDLINMIIQGVDTLYPSAAGHEYITSEILEALSIKEATRTVMYGDVNSDGVVNGKDLLRLQKYLTGEDVVIDAEAANVVVDDSINGKDLLRLQKYLAGENVVLG